MTMSPAFPHHAWSRAVVMGLALAVSGVAWGRATLWPTHPYGGPELDRWVRESFALHNIPRHRDFYVGFESAWQKSSGESLPAWIARTRTALAQVRGESRARREARLVLALEEAHRHLKRAIPRFSLDRGFEFALTHRLGERQCFLQSVLLDSILHGAGIRSGTVMVYRNPQGAESNLGHACNLVKVGDHRFVLIDASHSAAKILHQGLYLRVAGEYRFVRPREANGVIVGWQFESGDALRPAHSINPLDRDYLDSMFDYYRGERVPEGLLSAKPTAAGLRQSIDFLSASVRHSGHNPLAMFQLARAHSKAGQHDAAREHAARAIAIYRRGGFTPGSVTAFAASIPTTRR